MRKELTSSIVREEKAIPVRHPSPDELYEEVAATYGVALDRLAGPRRRTRRGGGTFGKLTAAGVTGAAHRVDPEAEAAPRGNAARAPLLQGRPVRRS